MDTVKNYTIEEAANILKVSKRFLYPYVKSGTLRGVKIGRAWRISEDALRDFLLMGAPVHDANRRHAKAEA